MISNINYLNSYSVILYFHNTVHKLLIVNNCLGGCTCTQIISLPPHLIDGGGLVGQVVRNGPFGTAKKISLGAASSCVRVPG